MVPGPAPSPTNRDDPRGARCWGAWLWGAAALLAALVIGVAVHKAWPVLFPAIAERAPLDAACDIRAAACTVRFADGGSVRLDIRPRGMPTARPLDVNVRLQGLPVPERMELDFTGVDMDMGYNRVTLMPVAGDPSRYAATAMLPVCVRERMRWEARVLLHLPNAILAAPFRFVTNRPGAAP